MRFRLEARSRKPASSEKSFTSPYGFIAAGSGWGSSTSTGLPATCCREGEREDPPRAAGAGGGGPLLSEGIVMRGEGEFFGSQSSRSRVESSAAEAAVAGRSWSGAGSGLKKADRVESAGGLGASVCVVRLSEWSAAGDGVEGLVGLCASAVRLAGDGAEGLVGLPCLLPNASSLGTMSSSSPNIRGVGTMVSSLSTAFSGLAASKLLSGVSGATRLMGGWGSVGFSEDLSLSSAIFAFVFATCAAEELVTWGEAGGVTKGVANGLFDVEEKPKEPFCTRGCLPSLVPLPITLEMIREISFDVGTSELLEAFGVFGRSLLMGVDKSPFWSWTGDCWTGDSAEESWSSTRGSIWFKAGDAGSGGLEAGCSTSTTRSGSGSTCSGGGGGVGGGDGKGGDGEGGDAGSTSDIVSASIGGSSTLSTGGA
eukprot:1194019-Prorocentrum_minimum.AAC.4